MAFESVTSTVASSRSSLVLKRDEEEEEEGKVEAAPVAGHDSCRDARVQYASSSGSVSLSDALRAER